MLLPVVLCALFAVRNLPSHLCPSVCGAVPLPGLDVFSSYWRGAVGPDVLGVAFFTFLVLGLH